MSRHKLLLLVLLTLALGALVVALNPDYRATFLSLLTHPNSNNTPILQSNSDL